MKSLNDNMIFNSVYNFESEPDTLDVVEDDDEDVESIIRGAHLESRLFFEPSKEKSIAKSSPFEESVAMALESEDPYSDFRSSMEEMVRVINISKNKQDWVCLEELLSWYLSVNAKNNHAYIIAAFIDLLVKISSDDDTNNEGLSSSNSSSRISSSSSSSNSSS